MSRSRLRSLGHSFRFASLVGLVCGAMIVSIVSSTNAAARTYCTGDGQAVASGTMLFDSVQTVFGRQAARRPDAGEGCNQVTLLHYSDADVLLVNVPDGDCHGCGGSLSAYVLQRQHGSLRLIRSIPNFETGGAWGLVGTPTATRFNGNDAIVLKSGYSNHGNSIELVSIFMFQSGRIVRLTQQPITLSTDNGGAVADANQAVSVEGQLILAGETNQLTIKYSVMSHGAARMDYVVWGLRGGRLEIVNGSEPPEIGQVQ